MVSNSTMAIIVAGVAVVLAATTGGIMYYEKHHKKQPPATVVAAAGHPRGGPIPVSWPRIPVGKVGYRPWEARSPLHHHY